MFKSVILPAAKTDIREASLWYNTQQSGLGKRFSKEVRRTVLLIRKNPEVFAVHYDSTRCAVLDVFPFMIHYSIDYPKETIIVAAVYHTSLNPERWRKNRR